MYTTGTEFYKALAEAQGKRKSINTAADTAEQVVEVVERHTPFKVKSVILERGCDMTMKMVKRI